MSRTSFERLIRVQFTCVQRMILSKLFTTDFPKHQVRIKQFKYKYSLNTHMWKSVHITRLTEFSPMFHFYPPWKHKKTSGVLTFSGDQNGALG